MNPKQTFKGHGVRIHHAWLGALLLLTLLLPACSVQTWAVRSVADELASQGALAEDDLVLAREASAFYLKLSESVLQRVPDHAALAQSVVGGFVQYAYAFVAEQADRMASTDAPAAQLLRERAAKLYGRAQRQGWRSLQLRYPGLEKSMQTQTALATAGFAEPAGRQLKLADVGLVYWTAAAWGGQISLSKDKPEVVADLPLVLGLAHWAWRLQPDYGQGDLAALMGQLEMARPGGSSKQALAYFDQALVAAQGRSAGVWVAKAEGWALAQSDRTLFEQLLTRALAVPVDPSNMAQRVMRDRATWLLTQLDDLF